ncbi:hypothetical protein AB6A40_001140 [Gnathostoma spinigerum]|uniref:5-demethoxyubiquinone hydroxylase, mitochondrial n=1 Tax=Gnathostoma spinigerum TaxID=75299 RepID=A0ABD6E5P7_9BILA
MHRTVPRLLKAATPTSRQNLLDRIIRVDHVGELAADRIYAAQTAIFSGKPIANVVEKMWAEEKEHLHTMERLCARHDVSPSIFVPVFSLAAYALGAVTALAGQEAAMACTVAVEDLIEKHYNDQMKDLIADDPEVHSSLLNDLKRLRDEEVEHHNTGVAHDGLRAPNYEALKLVIQTGCKGAIWLAERM